MENFSAFENFFNKCRDKNHDSHMLVMSDFHFKEINWWKMNPTVSELGPTYCKSVFRLYQRFMPYPTCNMYVIGKLQTGNIFTAYANLSIMFFQSSRHGSFEKNVEEGG